MKLLLLILTIFLFACGPSQEDKQYIIDFTGENKNEGESLILQVGVFKRINDAEIRKAELLLLDLPARVEKSVFDNKEVWYLVLMGPYSDISKMRRARSQLIEHDFSYLIVRK